MELKLDSVARLDTRQASLFLPPQEGEEPKLKPDSEYPDWLWTLDTQPKRNVTIDDFEPDSQEYWDFLKMEARKQKHKRMQIKRRHHIF